MLAHTIWSNTNVNSSVKPKDIEDGVNIILNKEDAAFFNIWDNLTLNQRKLLIALTSKDVKDKIFSSEFIKTFDLTSSSSVQRGIVSLYSKDLIDKQKDEGEINDVFFKHWIRKKFINSD